MKLTDTHSHLYLPHFADDIDDVIGNARANKISHILLPNIDTESTGPMLELCRSYPAYCFPMIGLHPASVKENYRQQLKELESLLDKGNFVAVGETGMDAYWDKTFLKEQEDAFITQLEWAKKLDLPVVIHSRETMDRIITIVRSHQDSKLRGVFHAFSGNLSQAEEVKELGFKIGIGGVITFRNSNLPEIVSEVGLHNIVLETDAPYLTPVPYRGKRNESSYLIYIAREIARIKGITLEKVAKVTTANACDLFKLSCQ